MITRLAARGNLSVVRGEADEADVTIAADSSTLQSLVFAGRPLTDAERAGKASVVGYHRAAEHLLRCFPPSVRPAPEPSRAT